jgi:hypothetical protein
MMATLSWVKALTVVGVLASTDSGWEQAAQTDGITVFTRAKEGSGVREVKANAKMDSPPHAVWAVIRDYEHYKDNMPYTKESQVLERKDGGKITYFYSVIDAPFVDKRDFVLKIIDESDWKEGQGFLKARWSTSEEKRVAERRRMTRLKLNDGYWLLEPRDEGKTTWVTYYLFTDPGGAIPNFIVNKANTSAIPDLFRSIRKLALKQAPPAAEGL